MTIPANASSYSTWRASCERGRAGNSRFRVQDVMPPGLSRSHLFEEEGMIRWHSWIHNNGVLPRVNSLGGETASYGAVAMGKERIG